MILDGMLVMVALKLAQIIRPQMVFLSPWVKEISPVPPIPPLIFFVFAGVWVIVFMQFDLYNPEKYLRATKEFYQHLIASLAAITIIAGFLYLTEREFSRVLFLSFGLLATIFLYTHRWLYRIIIRRGLFQNGHQQRILVIGAGIVGRRIAQAIKRYQPLGFDIIGYLDDNVDLINTEPDVLGSLDQAVEIINEYQVENIVFALPRRAYDRINNLISNIHKLPVHVWIIPDYFALALNQATVLEFAGFPMIDLRAPALNKYQRFTKRIFDLVFTIPFFLMSLPLFGLISLAIKLDSPGPVFYFSPRLKENGELFKMIKFRTMVQYADLKLKDVIQKDKDGNLIHKHPEDPRVTRLGKFLRKTSLDELPQLLHVIRGDMSLVGPRPELPSFVDRYEHWQRRRFAVPQGMTGWWQVNGRSDKPMHLHTDEDIYYIQHYSIWLDIQILIRTFWIVLRSRGAY
jgi:exopolysaccharide biosynthesis polyprenyl glycosylphosphotransferase